MTCLGVARLRNFEIGNARHAHVAFNESISLIFSGSAQRMAYGSFYPNAKEVRVIGTKGALFKEFISVDGHVTVDGEIFAENLSLKDCTGLSTLKVRACHGEVSYGGARKEEGYSKSKIELVNLIPSILRLMVWKLVLVMSWRFRGVKT